MGHAVEATELQATELQALVRHELRSSKSPDTIVFRDTLPHTETGNLLRRIVLNELVTP